MRREAPWRRRERLRQQWHRKFAWTPREINGEQVWLEHYWRRFVAWPAPKTKAALEYYSWRSYAALLTHQSMPWGRWEYGVGRYPPVLRESPMVDGAVIQFKRPAG